MKVDRLVSIIMILLDKKRVSAQELADTFEVTKRTIYRDIDAICMAGIPVSAISGVGGGFEIMSSYKVDKNVFSSTELTALLMGLSGLSNLVHGKELVHALSKVKTFIPADKAKEIEVKSSQILIDMDPWVNNTNIISLVETIQVAMQENHIISFIYSDIRGNKTERKTEPYQLILKNRNWYFYGYCLSNEDFRLFRLSRTLNLHMTDETFNPREYKKPQLNIDDHVKKIQRDITLRIHISIADRVLDYCPFERFAEDGDEHYIVSYPFIENDFYYDMLLSFGSKCECVEPLNVRNKLKEKILELSKIYS